MFASLLHYLYSGNVLIIDQSETIWQTTLPILPISASTRESTPWLNIAPKNILTLSKTVDITCTFTNRPKRHFYLVCNDRLQRHGLNNPITIPCRVLVMLIQSLYHMLIRMASRKALSIDIHYPTKEQFKLQLFFVIS